MDGLGLCGLLNLNKPTGITSRAALDRVSRPLRRVKVGHAGTLDPLASGVLVVAVGPATRLIEYVQGMDKAYRTTVLLGATSPTDDADGEVTPVPGASAPSFEAVAAAVATQVGWLDQRPPEFSALKVAGERSYDLARAGRAVTLAARPVRVDSVRVVAYEWPRLELEIVCGSGTYVRSIARDIGAALGCGGLVEVFDPDADRAVHDRRRPRPADHRVLPGGRRGPAASGPGSGRGLAPGGGLGRTGG